MSTPNLADIYARITQLTQQAEPVESPFLGRVVQAPVVTVSG